jgi:hypothetical protein
MNPKNPPRIATWMMEHLTPSGSDDAIAGDLFEHFCAGRSTGWYWRQVVGAIAAEWSRRVWPHRAPLLFAAMWSFLAPAWVLLNTRLHWDSFVVGALLRIPWPWSTICSIFLASAVGLLFVWLGVLVYVVLCRIALGRLRLGRPGIAILSSIVAFTAAQICAILITVYASSHTPGHAIDERTLRLIGEVRDLRLRTMLLRLRYFPATACAMWFLDSEAENPARLAS